MPIPNNINLIIFDADGTLRRRKDGQNKAPLENADWELVPGIEEAINGIRYHPVVFGIASNQACIGRGEVTETSAEQMLRLLAHDLNLGLGPMYPTVQMCPHLPEENCVCRKPAPGMLYSIMMYWNIPAENTLFVGDADIDKEAAHLAGCQFMSINEFLEKE